jgi:hypothetical protein
MTDWRGGGVENIRRAGFSTSHRLISEPDYLALPGLLRSGASFDFVYLDGWHNFDYTLLDFFFADLMLSPSGVVGFNDCDWKPVARVLSFVQGHRHYDRIDFCLPARWGDRGKFSRTSRRALHRLNPSLPESRAVGPLLGRRREDQYFRKLDAWEPPHGYWKALRTRPWPSHGKVGPVYRP